MVVASRGLSEAMVGVSSSRLELPSFGPEDAVSVIEATCPPLRGPLRVGSCGSDHWRSVRVGLHDTHQDHRGVRFDTHSWLLRHRFQPDRVYQTARRVPPRRCMALGQREWLSFEQGSPTNSLNPRWSSRPCSAMKAGPRAGIIAPDLARVRRAVGVHVAEDGHCSPAATGLTISLMLAATRAASSVGCPLAQPCHSLKPEQPGIEGRSYSDFEPDTPTDANSQANRWTRRELHGTIISSGPFQ